MMDKHARRPKTEFLPLTYANIHSTSSTVHCYVTCSARNRQHHSSCVHNFELLFCNLVQAALSKFGLPCAFLGKSDLYSFS